MNATMFLRPTCSTLGYRTSFELDEPTRYKCVPAKEERTEAPPALRFEHELGRFHQALGLERDAARCAIVKKILAADEPDEFIQAVIRTFVSSSRPGRLDDAVDILSQCGRLLPQFVVSGVLTPSQPASVDEDYWYVLIRSIGKSSLPAARLLVELLWSRSPEAAVEALGDIGDAESLQKLHAIATRDDSDSVRRLAQEILEECSE